MYVTLAVCSVLRPHVLSTLWHSRNLMYWPLDWLVRSNFFIYTSWANHSFIRCFRSFFWWRVRKALSPCLPQTVLYLLSAPTICSTLCHTNFKSHYTLMRETARKVQRNTLAKWWRLPRKPHCVGVSLFCAFGTKAVITAWMNQFWIWYPLINLVRGWREATAGSSLRISL